MGGGGVCVCGGASVVGAGEGPDAVVPAVVGDDVASVVGAASLVLDARSDVDEVAAVGALVVLIAGVDSEVVAAVIVVVVVVVEGAAAAVVVVVVVVVVWPHGRQF